MDRKSFFKRTLLALGAAIVPTPFLKAKAIKETVFSIEPESKMPMFPYQDGVMPLYNQMQHAFGNYNRVAKADRFYWAEYESEGDEFGIIQGLNPPPTPIKFTLNKNISV